MTRLLFTLSGLWVALSAVAQTGVPDFAKAKPAMILSLESELRFEEKLLDCLSAPGQGISDAKNCTAVKAEAIGKFKESVPLKKGYLECLKASQTREQFAKCNTAKIKTKQAKAVPSPAKK